MVRDRKITVEEVVRHASLDRLGDVVTVLMRYHSSQEVCSARLERIASSPLDQFNRLKAIYFDHCVGGAARTE
jgi:hypothetical protein